MDGLRIDSSGEFRVESLMWRIPGSHGDEPLPVISEPQNPSSKIHPDVICL